MATTEHLNLPLYEQTDAPNLLDQYNEAMQMLDNIIYALQQAQQDTEEEQG